MAYHSNGALNQDICYNLPLHLRNFYYKLLVDWKKKESVKEEKEKPLGFVKR